MALGLGEASRLGKYKRKMAAKDAKKQADDELIFNIEDEELADALTQSLNLPSTSKALTQTGSLKLKKSPNRNRFASVREAKPVSETHSISEPSSAYIPFRLDPIAGAFRCRFDAVVLCAERENRQVFGQFEFLLHSGIDVGEGKRWN